jgi:hypothetical protein
MPGQWLVGGNIGGGVLKEQRLDTVGNSIAGSWVAAPS